MPPEEAEDYKNIIAKEDLETVFLTSPTTSENRLELIDNSTTGFVYYVSRLGVTGKRQALPNTVCEKLDELRKSLENKVVVGFGISTPKHVSQLAPHADGVVVGSAIVKLIADNPPKVAAEKVKTLVSSLVAATKWR